MIISSCALSIVSILGLLATSTAELPLSSNKLSTSDELEHRIPASKRALLEDAENTTRMIVAFKPSMAKAVQQAVAATLASNNQAQWALAEATLTELPSGTLAAMSIDLPPAGIDALSRDPNVAFVEEDHKRYLSALTSPSTGHPFKIGQLVPYGVQMVQADLLASTDASNRKVCIIDKGFDLGHEDLPSDPSIVTGDDVGIASWNVDYNGHGTHVAGTIAALNNNGTGVVGVHSNNSLKLHIINVFGESEYASSFDVVNAGFSCMYAGANVISMSLGGPGFSRWESQVYKEIYDSGILIVAAAGNDGLEVMNYPAGYDSVVSVAAIDEKYEVASFSTFNDDVELSAPGVNVLSTMPTGTGISNSLVVGNKTYAPLSMLGSPRHSVSAPLADFGIGNIVDSKMDGKVCLIARGLIYFSEKVLNCQASGGVAAVIYNSSPESFEGDILDADTLIPSLSVSGIEGASLLKQLGEIATVTVTASNYGYFSGTSMATPHVSAVAALVWALNPECSASQIRESLTKSALDLGSIGYDMYYGFGLVQAKAADDFIKKLPTGKPTSSKTAKRLATLARRPTKKLENQNAM